MKDFYAVPAYHNGLFSFDEATFYESSMPATHSYRITTNLLKDELGFDGVIITDGMEMGGLTESTWVGESTIKAVEAGADILLLPLDVDQAINSLLDAVNSGRISEDRIDKSVKRIWKMKSKLKILQGNYALLINFLSVVRRTKYYKKEFIMIALNPVGTSTTGLSSDYNFFFKVK